ncbi:hypothetical protein LB579_29285 [Mesorhizobium sp. BR1-1-7]|uniref:hypothetical protein n=1 Tax=Mesorhizobium sp. BR1-1-7 TaxID=2876647 RepID=UPI001CCD6DD5|nr:hypothetical protein [Mesorhizobium sp. BR1-1-7]MBZ9921789.1 hypothetical protein [Mesorhizobium sp. BR1-1-7]
MKTWLIRELTVWVGVGVSAGIAWLASWSFGLDFWHLFIINVAAIAFGASFDVETAK